MSSIVFAFVIPFLFWGIDVVAKQLGGIDIADSGADLCLIGLSFSCTSMLSSAILASFQNGVVNRNSVDHLTSFTQTFVLVSLLIYLIALLLVKESDANTPQWLKSLRERQFPITIGFGFIMLFAEAIIYTVLLINTGQL